MARNLSLLIADSDVDSRFEAAAAVRDIGFDVAGESAHGTEAAVLATESQPDLVLVAVEDPAARGLGTMDALQQVTPDIPLLAYSSSSDVDLVRQAMRAGARDFLVKPIRPEVLRDAVNSVLAQEEQRRMARWAESSPAAARGTVITVAGAKGGIGKSTISANLAIALRQVTGEEVALVDGDAQFGDVSVMLDLDVHRSVADLAREEEHVTRESVMGYVHKHHSGLSVLMAASEPDDWRALQPHHVSSIATALAETHEFVVFDTPGTMNDVVAASLNEAAIVLMVTSLDISSVKDSRTALRILDAWGFARDRVRLVVNDNNHASAVTPDDVARATGMSIAQHIQYEPKVGLSVQTGLPMVESQPRSAFSRSILNMARTIAGVGAGSLETQPQRRRGLARLLMSRKSA